MIRRLGLVLITAACLLLMWVLWMALDNAAAASSAVFPARTAYASTASRDLTDLVRPSLPTSGSAEPTTSPSAVRASGSQLRSVAAVPPAPAATAGEGEQAASYKALRARISWCESRNEPTAVNPTSGAAGLYQFLDATFEAVTGLPGKASGYSAEVQTAAFDRLYAADGTSPWNSSKGCWSK